MTGTAIQRPRPARLGSAELRAYAETALPYALVMDRNGITWTVNRRFQRLSRRSKSDPNRWVNPTMPGAPPRPARPDVISIVPLYDDERPPWADYHVLHAIEFLWRRWRPETVGSRVYTADPCTRGEADEVADTRDAELV
jgi:hypothetical protein